MKPVPVFMARNRVSKSCLMADLCFRRFVNFDCVPIYISAFTASSVLAIRRTSLLWGSPLSYSVALKGRNASATALQWFASDTAHIVFKPIQAHCHPLWQTYFKQGDKIVSIGNMIVRFRFNLYIYLYLSISIFIYLSYIYIYIYINNIYVF